MNFGSSTLALIVHIQLAYTVTKGDQVRTFSLLVDSCIPTSFPDRYLVMEPVPRLDGRMSVATGTLDHTRIEFKRLTLAPCEIGTKCFHPQASLCYGLQCCR